MILVGVAPHKAYWFAYWLSIDTVRHFFFKPNPFHAFQWCTNTAAKFNSKTNDDDNNYIIIK